MRTIFVALILLAGCKAKSDQGLVSELIDQTLAAANEKRAGDVVASAAEDFKGPRGADLRECRRILTGYFLQHGWLHVFEKSRTIDVQGSSATVKLDLVIAAGREVKKLEDLLPTDGTHLLFDIALEKTNGAWLYKSATYSNVR